MQMAPSKAGVQLISKSTTQAPLSCCRRNTQHSFTQLELLKFNYKEQLGLVLIFTLRTQTEKQAHGLRKHKYTLSFSTHTGQAQLLKNALRYPLKSIQLP